MERLKLQTSNLLCSFRSFNLRWCGQFRSFHATFILDLNDTKNFKKSIKTSRSYCQFFMDHSVYSMCAWYTVRKCIITPKWRCWWSNTSRIWNTRYWTDSEFAWTLSCFRTILHIQLVDVEGLNTEVVAKKWAGDSAPAPLTLTTAKTC